MKRVHQLADERDLTGASLAREARELRARTAAAMHGDEATVALALTLALHASRDALELELFPEQIAASAALYAGRAIEMATGEGKTLAGAVAASAHALCGRAVHVVTPNEYLADRDARWMGPLFAALGLEACVVHSRQQLAHKQRAYRADVTYGTATEIAFDELRDQMRTTPLNRVQRGATVAIIDEVDSILVDAAHAPFVISRGDPSPVSLYRDVAPFVPRLRRERDFVVHEDTHDCTLTESGLDHATWLLREHGLLREDQELFERGELLHVVHQSLRAHTLYARDRDYLVTEDGTIELLDPFTGRRVPGRRWTDGLHQAVEAKERVAIQSVQQPQASCSVPGFFRRYEILAGMSGTTTGVAEELREVYGVRTVRIPPSHPSCRLDECDRAFATERAKLDALIDEVVATHRRGQPVLVGTLSESKAALVSRRLKARGVSHGTLTATNHAHEAAIVAEAGCRGAVTVTTQIAGRGTDIRLGGTDASLTDVADVRALGGLRVLGLERHFSRRVDDQLRGRAGRQGEPGSSRFFVSLEDELLVRHLPYRRWRDVSRRGGLEGRRVDVSKLADEAQQRAQEERASTRKRQRELNAPLDAQRDAFDALRERVLCGALDGADSRPERSQRGHPPDPIIVRLSGPAVHRFVHVSYKTHGTLRPRLIARDTYRLFGIPVETGELEPYQADVERLTQHLQHLVAQRLTVQWRQLRAMTRATVAELIREAVAVRSGEDMGFDEIERAYRDLVRRPGPSMDDCVELERAIERLSRHAARTLRRRLAREGPRRVLRYARMVHLRTLDAGWRAHLGTLASLRDQLGLRTYGARQPLTEYEHEAYARFREMLATARTEALRELFATEPIDAEALRTLDGAAPQ